MRSVRVIFLVVSVYAVFLMNACKAQMPGFVSLDCGGNSSFTDELGLQWIPDKQMTDGKTAIIAAVNETRQQYRTLRYFPVDNRKYCYTLNVMPRTRYLIRASFLYGNFDSNNVYPSFDISFGPTHWSRIDISDANTMEIEELIFLATDSTVSVCLSNTITGKPFISSLELRQFNGSVYYNQYEKEFFLSVAARINFGAESESPVRYPDDPFDRIWLSDSLKMPNYLVDVAPGTEKISTKTPIDVRWGEMPPQKVMQTAVVGRNGSLTYRLNLEGFPSSGFDFGWAFAYFAEIENLGPNDTRKFSLVIDGIPPIDNTDAPIIDITENAQGEYRLYEPGFVNMTLPFVFSFKFGKTNDSTKGPLLNALEINKYLKINDGSLDGPVLADIIAAYSSAEWAKEGGDPCLPKPWSWVHCSSDPQPRITSIFLSGKNLTGTIPSELTMLSGLVELWLNNNSLTGSIPDFSGCPSLKKIHLEDNQLTGKLPSSLGQLPNLRELYIQNNLLSGEVPSGLFNKHLDLNYTGNPGLHKGVGGNRKKIIIGTSVGAALLFTAAIIVCIFLYEQGKLQTLLPFRKPVKAIGGTAVESAHCFRLREIEHATKNFQKIIGSGGFGVVHYGRLKDGREIAVKTLTNNSFQGEKEFSNEVSLLSRIHHKNLVQFLGYCYETGKSALVYEFMHNGTLKERLYGPLTRSGGITWIKRLLIAEDAARGIEYLHTGCHPSIIHRDLKTSNILLDKNMRAKVSDFGLSKLSIDGASHVTSIIRGTFGYLDPEYYVSQQLTQKSDVYSFGVILLELIAGQEPISTDNFGSGCRNIVQWAQEHVQNGNIEEIIDPSLHEYNLESMWKIAEKALMCVQPHGSMRPSISDVIKDIQEAIALEKKRCAVTTRVSSDELSRNSAHSSRLGGSFDFGNFEHFPPVDDTVPGPSVR